MGETVKRFNGGKEATLSSQFHKHLILPQSTFLCFMLIRVPHGGLSLFIPKENKAAFSCVRLQSRERTEQPRGAHRTAEKHRRRGEGGQDEMGEIKDEGRGGMSEPG